MDAPFLLHHGLCLPWLETLPANSVDHVITDPPYDEATHSKSRSGRNLPDAENSFSCKARRAVEFGFDPLGPEEIAALAVQFARVTKRWVLVFTSVELSHVWREALVNAGLDYVRTGAWVKLRATPQFTGDRPAVAFEAIVIAHRKGRKRWNGGGKAGIWTHPVVANCNGHRQDRVHTTQKPLTLMTELVADFTDEGDTVCDPFMGSATTGVAAIRLGRRFLGCEMQPREGFPGDADYYSIARDRLGAELANSDLAAVRSGQVPLFSVG